MHSPAARAAPDLQPALRHDCIRSGEAKSAMDRRYRHWRFRQGSRRATQTPSQKLLSHPEGTVQLNAWLGRQDSNLGMAVPKTAALPLGDAPMCGAF